MKSKLPKDTLFFFFLNCGLNLTPTNQSTLVDIHIDKMRSTRIQKKRGNIAHRHDIFLLKNSLVILSCNNFAD